MFKEIGRVTELLKYPQNKILDLDKVAHINGEGLTLTIATEECAELNLAITNAIIVGGYDFWERAAIGYGVQEFYNKCIHRNAPNLNKGIEEFYLSLIANAKAQKSEVKENVKRRKI